MLISGRATDRLGIPTGQWWRTRRGPQGRFRGEAAPLPALSWPGLRHVRLAWHLRQPRASV
eukprot:10437222-Heterocapsa_arctica.AAC.1